ncbi:uncharacterized protein LOC125375991 [Haliotis rufescens]|uniref:uncharacterized protein LOC125375991 n=1 Tax=Haliotis rufescens TaxID=6454 RepID=UPI00201F0BA5|nr:uncharacterized protein LOC125375991 [Haliotis rufescens]
MKSFRKHDLKPNTIAILPPQGYQPKRNYSQACMHWLNYLMETDPNLHLQHARNGEKEFTCGEGQHQYNVDGYDRATGTIYEFLRCFWHGCQACHKTHCGEPHPVLGTPLGARYTNTRYRLSLLSQHPEVKRIVTLWEHEFTKMQQENSILRAFLQGPPCIRIPGPLNPRDAFYGGRTNANEAQEDETIKYINICSLYPYICKTGAFPMGHSTPLHQPPVDTLFELKGLIQCRVLPPKRLYHPLLPYRSGGKLLCPLCLTYADTWSDSPCKHTDKEGSWHDPDTQQVRLFDTYIDRHFKEKLEASGYPEGCTDHGAYIQEIYDKEGIGLDKDRIEKNPRLRTIAKMQLTSLWGKFGQRLDYSHNIYMNDPVQDFALWRNEHNTIEDVTVVNEHMVEVTYTQRKNSKPLILISMLPSLLGSLPKHVSSCTGPLPWWVAGSCTLTRTVSFTFIDPTTRIQSWAIRWKKEKGDKGEDVLNGDHFRRAMADILGSG